MARWIRVISTRTETKWDYEIPLSSPECLQKIVELIGNLDDSRITFGGYVGPAIEIRSLSAPSKESLESKEW